MPEAQFWNLTWTMLAGVSLIGGVGFLYVWNGSGRFDRRFGRGPE